jgi:signal transduction histidine kinase/ActR/RegA family two-component response regulator
VNRRNWIFVSCLLLIAGAAAVWLYLRPVKLGQRTYRIGWGESPPFQERSPDGKPKGISVDLVAEAARRRGIALEWIYWTDSSQSALERKQVDLWPLITITPARLEKFHISEPYLQHEHCLLVREDSTYGKVADLATGSIGMANVSIDSVNLRTVLPAAKAAPHNNIAEVLDDVCRNVTDAAFMDRYTAIAALLQEAGCDGHKLRWLPIPQLQTRLGVGSTFETAAIANAIRKEIGAMAEEGKIPNVFGQWGFMSGHDVASVEFLLDARRRETRLYTVAGVFGIMFVVACWQTVRLIRERTRSQKTEEALRESQERYMQAQKMESVGRLAGGVAHDFNNLLTVINGYSDLLFQQLPDSDPRRAEADEIRKAGARAADLTRQLLAFGRKQVGRPRSLNLNSVVVESENMLRRLLGEDVQLITRLEPSLGLVMADPGHVHQVLMNLAVNARDAMPDGGTLLIETGNANLESQDAATQPESKPGPAVRLSVHDTGNGMDEKTQKNIFEPFFTTKGNKGTGLGLATVYGIVQQNHGWIGVFSKPGQGSTFQVYLPRVAGTNEPALCLPPANRQQKGTETVLVVEDQDEVRDFAVQALANRGYSVLQAADGPQALALSERHTGIIDVLLTDVVLPGMNGRELAERFKAMRPGIKLIYTSGYAQDIIANRGVLLTGAAYVSKPYTADEIALKVRAAIENTE